MSVLVNQRLGKREREPGREIGQRRDHTDAGRGVHRVESGRLVAVDQVEQLTHAVVIASIDIASVHHLYALRGGPRVRAVASR